MISETEQVYSETIDHLGLVAAFGVEGVHKLLSNSHIKVLPIYRLIAFNYPSLIGTDE